MKSTVSINSFRDAFQRFNRDNFSYEGLDVLFTYLEELEEGMGEEIELDVIALCCDYAEGSFEDIACDYSIDLTDCEDDDEKREAVREYLDNNTQVCGDTEAGFVYCSSF
jgi:hypothetical protein